MSLQIGPRFAVMTMFVMLRRGPVGNRSQVPAPVRAGVLVPAPAGMPLLLRLPAAAGDGDITIGAAVTGFFLLASESVCLLSPQLQSLFSTAPGNDISPAHPRIRP